VNNDDAAYTTNYKTNNKSAASVPPVAKVAAFVGPTLFDWIDIEYNASTKIQSIFRRYLVLEELDEMGMTTSYVRNCRRQRKAAAAASGGGGGGGMSLFRSSTVANGSSKVDESAPDLGFGCCAIGLAFGGGGDDDDDENNDDNENDHDSVHSVNNRNIDRKEYHKKTREQAEREENLRQQYLQQRGYRDSVTKIAESIVPAELLRP
jgi:hypothetical protein